MLNELGSKMLPRGPQFVAVPKCFLNICSSLKVKSRVKASLALDVHLYAEDTDIRMISETHLNRNEPDFSVGISNYTIYMYRRDRDYFANDNRKKEEWSYERITTKCIFLATELPSKHGTGMLVCGL